jgi:hypothetical protein
LAPQYVFLLVHGISGVEMKPGPYSRLVGAVGLSLALLAGPCLCWALPGFEVSVPQEEVRDPFYAYMIGLLLNNVCGLLSTEEMAEVLSAYQDKSVIPFATIKDVRRDCFPTGGRREVVVNFWEGLKTPIPYSILGYHPGSVRTSDSVKFFEWALPEKIIHWSRQESIKITDIYVFGVHEGWAVIDIDGWVDVLLGDLLDDTRVAVMVLFKYRGQWHGLAAGYGRNGEGRSGVFNFSENRVLLPTPQELRNLGPYFRHYVTRTKGLTLDLPSDDWRSGPE